MGNILIIKLIADYRSLRVEATFPDGTVRSVPYPDGDTMYRNVLRLLSGYLWVTLMHDDVYTFSDPVPDGAYVQ